MATQFLTIDQQIEDAKGIIRAGGKVDEQPTPSFMDELFPQTDAARLEEAISRLVELVMIRTINADKSGSPDSYDRL